MACNMSSVITASLCLYYMKSSPTCEPHLPLLHTHTHTHIQLLLLLQTGKMQGVLVERCRYLEQAGCASICINSCKVPTQVGSNGCCRGIGIIIVDGIPYWGYATPPGQVIVFSYVGSAL
jgi:Beta-carotene isomerase D27-like, C-terminal